MEIKKILLGAGVSALTSFAVSSVALADYSSDSVKQHYSIGVNVGTSTIGIDAAYKINNYLEPKIFGNYFQWTVSNNESINNLIMDVANGALPFDGNIDSLSIPSELKVVYENVGATIDFHPFRNGFYLSAGVAYNNTHASFGLTSKGLKVAGHIGGVKINANGDNVNLEMGGLGNINLHNDLGNAKVEIKWNPVVPYFGIGFRGNFAEANLQDPTFLENLGFTFDMGSYYYGNPTIKLSANSGIIDKEKIAKLNDEIQDKVKDYTKYASFWPVFRIGLTYRF